MSNRFRGSGSRSPLPAKHDARHAALAGKSRQRASRGVQAQAEKASLESQLATVSSRLKRRTEPVTPEQVFERLNNFSTLLEDAAAGRLGQDVVYKAASVFRELVGQCITVHVEVRAGRKRMNVRGEFRPQIVQTVQDRFTGAYPLDREATTVVSVWLREPPLRDRLASRVHELIDDEGLSYRDAAKAMHAEGHCINSGVIWQIYQRYWEMRGEPPRRNNGRKRRQRGEPAA